MTIDGGKLQDAFHYALQAAGGQVDEWFSAIDCRNPEHSRSAYLRKAERLAREAGLTLAGRRSLQHAPEFARTIHGAAKLRGWDAYTGERIGMVFQDYRRTRDETT
jgi:hypothetical protein